ncbi:carboxypeptidase regulatory-like domain-containing protein [Paraburkholderia sacchari]|uniref:carboxypeptidase regulatory-like domain-containing protein n=1 Tax=Paraburkholderia sacchari TaxID=159450 RepID=UPI001BCC6650|nr:carboxypeptidase regulatory-like domain-containing protein [Paraburkholderia sacchari]
MQLTSRGPGAIDLYQPPIAAHSYSCFIDAARRNTPWPRSRQWVPVMSALSRLPAIVFIAGLAVFAGAGDAQTTHMPVERNGVPYITGGIGQTEVEAFRAQASQYNLRMTFATKTGSYLADVDVSIWREPHQRLLRVRTHGPFLFVRVPAGRYEIEVHLRSQSVTQTVQVPARGGTETVIRLEDPDKCGVIILCRKAQ